MTVISPSNLLICHSQYSVTLFSGLAPAFMHFMNYFSCLVGPKLLTSISNQYCILSVLWHRHPCPWHRSPIICLWMALSSHGWDWLLQIISWASPMAALSWYHCPRDQRNSEKGASSVTPSTSCSVSLALCFLLLFPRSGVCMVSAYTGRTPILHYRVTHFVGNAFAPIVINNLLKSRMLCHSWPSHD